MKLTVSLASGEVLIIDDCCEHDLTQIRRAIDNYHTRWLRRRRQHTVEINSGSSRYVILTRDIRSVGLS